MAANIKKECMSEKKQEMSYLESTVLSRMSTLKLIYHFAAFFLFLAVLIVVSSIEAKSGWGKLSGMFALFLVATLSLFPWLRDFWRR